MIDLDQIRKMKSKAAKAARADKTKPFVVYNNRDIERLSSQEIRLPFLGDYCPEGFYVMNEIFVDSSGFGSDSEPAMTLPKFFGMLDKLGKPFGLAISEAGEFQVMIKIYGVN